MTLVRYPTAFGTQSKGIVPGPCAGGTFFWVGGHINDPCGRLCGMPSIKMDIEYALAHGALYIHATNGAYARDGWRLGRWDWWRDEVWATVESPETVQLYTAVYAHHVELYYVPEVYHG